MLFLLLFSSVCFGSEKDSVVSAEIRKQFQNPDISSGLHYPKSVERFYAKNNYQPVWMAQNASNKQTLEAMLLLDCVVQFGLPPADYHPKERIYARMDKITDKNARVPADKRARFDLILTDALLTFMNHLHFGKLNTTYIVQKIEDENRTGFFAEAYLAMAIQQQDFMSAVLKVQPQTIEYAGLQDYLKLVSAQYQGDCYAIPDDEIRKIGINLERLRWNAHSDSSYLQVNIPAYELRFFQPDTVYNFRVIVGKEIHQTPELQSSITHLTTNPDWCIPAKIFRNEILPKMIANSRYADQNHIAVYDATGVFVSATKINLKTISGKPNAYFARQSAGCDNALGKIIFRFQNPYDIYLHDTPEPQLFNAGFRALSHGCIRVEDAEKLAELIFRQENSNPKITSMKTAIAAGKTRSVSLANPLPIKIVYLTCQIMGSILIQYPDVYHLNGDLADKLYGKIQPLVSELN